MRSRSLATHDVILMGWKDVDNEQVMSSIERNSWWSKGPSDLRNEGGMLSGPATPLHFIFLIVDSNSPI